MGIILNKDILLNRGVGVGVKINLKDKDIRKIPAHNRRYIKDPHSGYNVVDITQLDEIWVENHNGVWILHAAPFPNCQLVKMKASDKSKLAISSFGTFYIKTDNEIQKEKIQIEKKLIDSKINKVIGDKDPSIILYLITSIIKYLDTNDKKILDELKDIYEIINPIIPTDTKEKILKKQNIINNISIQLQANESERKI